MTVECSQWSYGLVGDDGMSQEEYSLVVSDKNFSMGNVLSWTITECVLEEYEEMCFHGQ